MCKELEEDLGKLFELSEKEQISSNLASDFEPILKEDNVIIEICDKCRVTILLVLQKMFVGK
jgi:hypothetical protein